MNRTLTKITSVEAVCFIIISTLNRTILNLPQPILKSCGSSSLLNIIYMGIIGFIFILLLIKLFKNFTNYDIIDISQYVGGNILKNIVGVLMCLYLIAFASFLIRDFADVINCLYYNETTILFLILFFVGTAFISNLFGSNSIFRVNAIVSIIMGISLIITFLSVIPNIVLQRIFPIFGNGIKETFGTGLTNLNALNGLILIYFVCPFLTDKKDFGKISKISVIIANIVLFLSTACLLLSLSFSTNVNDISAFYTLISNNEFGDFFQHPESLFVFTWILSILSYLNIMVLLILKFSQKVIPVKNNRIVLIIICVIIFSLAMLPHNIIEARNYENFIYNFISMPLGFIAFPIILIIAKKKKKKKGHSSNE